MNPIQSVVDYIKSSKAELEKVSWPTRQDTLRYGALVVVVTVVTAVFFAVLDFSLGKGIDAVLLSQPAPISAPAAATTPTTNPTPTNASDINVKPVDVQAVTPQGKPAQVDIKEVK